MLSGEDFGYLRDNEQNRLSMIVKKSLLVGAVLFSIACFIYITVNAYYFVYSDKNSNIKVISSPPEPIKIVDNDNPENAIKDIDKTIYDSIVGNKNLSRENLNRVKIIDKAETPVLSEIAQKEISQKETNKAEIKPQKVSSSNMMVYDSNPQNLTQNSSQKPKEQVFNETKSNQKTTTRGNAKGVARVQIAAMTSRDSAVDYWTKLRKSYPALFSNLDYFISEANLGVKGVFYRLQIGNFKSQVAAEEFCHKFISQAGKSKADCIIVE